MTLFRYFVKDLQHFQSGHTGVCSPFAYSPVSRFPACIFLLPTLKPKMYHIIS